MIDTSLVTKYNVPGPRYTSYPTVPYWERDSFSLAGWKESLKKSFKEHNKTEGISLYIHLPFCESMCTFCGCTKRITKNHSVEEPYIHALLKELALYRELLGERPVVQQVHLGGGTPTFFSEHNLKSLINGIFKIADRADSCEMSFEGHPNNTTLEHLQTLSALGFKRVCYGVQDYNETVQKAINRIQPFEHVQRATEMAYRAGYISVGHDIIYGLPFQTLDHVKNTIEKTIQLFPDRIAFYSYAHVPWIKGNGQRGYDEANLPNAEEKREQYETGKRLLLEAGYVEIGMDHFALTTDDLYFAEQEGRLHRNFMGYNASKTRVMLGLGVSAISDSWYSFAQNVKGIDEYYHLLENNMLPVYRGHLLTEEDLVIRQHILNLMCHFETRWDKPELCFDGLAETLIRLGELEADGLIEFMLNGLRVTTKGKAFVRNICLAFDLRLQRNKPETKLFSMTI